MGPLEFHPIIKRIRWGGTRLGTVLGKPIGDATNCAESWEVSDHGADQSVVVHGPEAGWNLSRLVSERGRALLGRHDGPTQFPLLIKYLDAHDRLSVQVHPNDVLAQRFDPGENGKTEAWVIIDAQPDSQLYVGLKTGVDRATLERRLAEGRVEECLHSFVVSPGDCVFIPAGTVHAIGEGILLAEVQQSSDLTFRLFDWGRTGTDGKPRELHIEQALDCIDFNRGPVDPVVPRAIPNDETAAEVGHRLEELVRSDYFIIRRHTGSTPFVIPRNDRFRAFMMLDGCTQLECEAERRQVKLGQTFLLPADAPETQLTPDDQIVLLETYLP